MTDEARPGHDSASPASGAPGFWHGAIVTAVTIVVAVALLVALFLAVWFMARPLALLLAAIVLANAIAPAVNLWERVLPEPAAIAVTYLLVVAAIAGVIWLVVPPLVAEAREAVTAAPALIEAAGGWLDRLSPGLSGTVSGSLPSVPAEAGTVLIEAPLALASGVIETVLVVVMAVYWTIASDGLRRYTLSIVPRHLRDEAADVAAEVVETIGGYLRARVMVGAIVGVLVYVGLLVLGVEYPGVLALLAGVGELVPYLGPSAAAIPALIVVLPSSPWLALGIVAFYLGLQQVKSHLLVPTIVRQQADIPPLLVIFALVVGTSSGGVVGAIVAPPLAGALRVILIRVVTPPLRRWADTTSLGSGRADQLAYGADRDPDQEPPLDRPPEDRGADAER